MISGIELVVPVRRLGSRQTKRCGGCEVDRGADGCGSEAESAGFGHVVRVNTEERLQIGPPLRRSEACEDALPDASRGNVKRRPSDKRLNNGSEPRLRALDVQVRRL